MVSCSPRYFMLGGGESLMSILFKKPAQTYDVHERENIILHMLLAVEAHHRVVHRQQHLDVVVVFLRVPPLALRLGQFVFDKIQSRGEVRDPEVRHCKI